MRFFDFSSDWLKIVFIWKNNHSLKISFWVKICFSDFFLLRYLVNLPRDLAPRACWPLKLPKIDLWPPKWPPWGQNCAKLTSFLNFSHQNTFLVKFSSKSENLNFYDFLIFWGHFEDANVERVNGNLRKRKRL